MRIRESPKALEAVVAKHLTCSDGYDVKLLSYDVVGSHTLAHLHVHACLDKHLVEVSNCLMELLLSRNALGHIELTADFSSLHVEHK